MDVVFQLEQVSQYLILRAVVPNLSNVCSLNICRSYLLLLFITGRPLDADLESLLHAQEHVKTLLVFLSFR